MLWGLLLSPPLPRPAKCWSEMKALTYDRWCDDVILGQGCRTPPGAAVIDERGGVIVK